jgi:hypothetical protein
MKLFKTLPCCPFLLAAYLLRRVPFLLRLCLLSCTSLPVREMTPWLTLVPRRLIRKANMSWTTVMSAIQHLRGKQEDNDK